MRQVVSITSQGQLTIPKSIRRSLGIRGAVKAVIKKRGRTIMVEPKSSFWSLEGSLKSTVHLSETDLKKARNDFAKNWGGS